MGDQVEDEGEPLVNDEYHDDDDQYDDDQDDRVLDPDRGYTDVPWIFLAIVVLITSVSLGIAVSMKEQMFVVNRGMDWRGTKCGTGDLESASLKGWVNPLFKDISMGAVCLESCPKTSNGGQVSTWGTIMCVCNPKIDADVSNPLTPLGAMCDTVEARKYGYVMNNNYATQSDVSSYVTYTDSTTERPCTFQFTTHEIMKMCLPALDALNYEQIVQQNCGSDGASSCGLTENLSKHLNESRYFVQRLLSDVTHCGVVIVMCCGFALLIALSLFFVIQHTYGTILMLWTNILWMLLLTIAALYAVDYYNERAAFEPTLASASSDQFSAYVLGTGAWVAGVGTLSMIVFTIHFSTQSFTQDKRAITEAPDVVQSDFKQNVQEGVGDTLQTSEIAARTLVLAGNLFKLLPTLYWSVFGQVLFTLALLGTFYALSFATISCGDIAVNEYDVSHLTFDNALQWSLLYHFLAFIWLVEVIDVIVAIISGGVVAMYVFAPTQDGTVTDHRVVPPLPVWHSFSTMGKYHIGTMVAGGTIIMLVRPVRLICDIIHLIRFGNGVPNSRWDQLKSDPNTCFGCIELWYRTYVLGMIRGTDKRAVIQTVLHGTPFSAATSATWHLNKHYGKYMAVPLYSSSTAMFITRNNIALSCCLIGHCLIFTESFDVKTNELQSTIMPLLMIFFFGHIIGWAFLCHLDAAVVTEMVGYAEARLRLYTPGVPQLTVPKDLLFLCHEAQVVERNEMKGIPHDDHN